MSLRTLSISCIDIEGQTLEIIILFAGLINLRICISWPSIIIIYFFPLTLLIHFCWIKKYKIDILDTNVMFFGDTIWPTAIIYSFCGTPSMKLKIRAWSLFEELELAVIEAKFLFILFDDI